MPIITGCCAECRHVYDLRFGILCPICRSSALIWASRLDDPEEPKAPWPHVLVDDGTRCRHDCLSCAWLRRDKPEIQWLDRLYELEDLR